MRQHADRSCHAPAYKVVVAGVATLAISAVGATTTVPTVRTMATNVVPLAAIDESSDTIGFADSDLYGMTPTQIDAQLDQMQADCDEDPRTFLEKWIRDSAANYNDGAATGMPPFPESQLNESQLRALITFLLDQTGA